MRKGHITSLFVVTTISQICSRLSRLKHLCSVRKEGHKVQEPYGKEGFQERPV